MNAAVFRKAKGFTLVELMVGLAIGMLVVLVIFEVVANFEGQKRTTTEGSGAQENGLYVVTTLERDIRMAGWGTNITPLLGCTGKIDTVYNGSPVADFSLMPVQITDGGTLPDRIAVSSGSGMLASTSNQVTSVGAPGNGALGVQSAVGFKKDDMVVVANGDGTCTLGQITNVNSSGNTIERKPGGSGSDFNPTAGVRAGWAPEDVGSKVHDLGKMVRRIYRVETSDDTLRSQDLGNPSDVSLADNIVSIKAQYGVSMPGTASQSVENWVNATGSIWKAPVPKDIARIKALRVLIVARSPVREKPDASGNCTATPTAPKASWTDGDPIVVDLSADSEWQCFRYKSFQTVIPLRNVIWSAT